MVQNGGCFAFSWSQGTEVWAGIIEAVGQAGQVSALGLFWGCVMCVTSWGHQL